MADINSKVTRRKSISRIKVACAIIEIENKTLVVQRSEKMSLPLKWEFPGGKVESNETDEECIKREIKEELNIHILVEKSLRPSNFDYPNISIKLIPFIAKNIDGEIRLKEHQQYVFLAKEELSKLDWAEVDIPILKEYLNQ
ncbi:MAG: (deoxy)nucleoside triphosphate pyrophosphohydrolase [Chitinophagaceae bacterium]|nr:MAG: (deoxy)nucleoside triphosphate pyrophosphohydrolase [Chitinophagaceae bacterium]